MKNSCQPVRTMLAFLVGIGAASVASAIPTPFVLDSSSADLSNVNPQSSFYKLDLPNSESGSATSLFDYAFGSDSIGEFVELTWGINPKPIIDGMGLKAGSAGSAAGGMFAMIWNASDFASFNASFAYDAIRVYQDGIVHKRHDSNFLGISHITVHGEEGAADVPDSGSTLALLAAGLAGLFLFRKRLAPSES